MVIDNAERVDEGTAPVAPSLRFFAGSFLRTWAVVALGSAVCGALAFSVVSLVWFFLAMPLAFVLGSLYGLPVILAVATWLTFQRPGPDPRRFVRALEVLGTAIALGINGTTNVVFAANAARPWPSHQPTNWWLVVGATLGAVGFTAASGSVGWICGATLAQRHLEAIDHVTAAERAIARRRRPWR